MGTLNKLKTPAEVKAIIPAEVQKDKALAETLRAALSLDVKDGSPEERKAKILRRELICKAFGISAKNIDQFLEDLENHIANASDNPLDNDPYIDDQNKSSKAKRKKNAENAFSFGLSVASSIIPGLKIISFVYNGIKILVDGINASSLDSEEPDYQKKINLLKAFMEKVNILNNKLDEKLDEILKNKETMKPKEFASYKNALIASIREEMKTYGVEIDADKASKLNDQANTTPDSEQQTEPGE